MTYRVNYNYYQYFFNDKLEIPAQHSFEFKKELEIINLFYKPSIEKSIKIMTANGYDITRFFDLTFNKILDIIIIKKKMKFDYNIFSVFKDNKNNLCL